MKKKGISLITLVITIVIVIILTTVIVISLTNSNMSQEAKKAAFAKEMTELDDMLKTKINTSIDLITGNFENIFEDENLVKKEDNIPETLKKEIIYVRNEEKPNKTDEEIISEYEGAVENNEIYYITNEMVNGAKNNKYIYDKESKTVFKVKQTKIYKKIYHSWKWYEIEKQAEEKIIEEEKNKNEDDYFDKLKGDDFNKLPEEDKKKEIEKIIEKIKNKRGCEPISYYEPTVLGDIDGDGEITQVDVYRVLEYTVGNIELTEAQKTQADYNMDGIINTLDAVAILDAEGYKRGYESLCRDDLVHGDINDWILQENRQNRIIGYKGTNKIVTIPNVIIKEGKPIYITEVGNGNSSGIFNYGVSGSASTIIGLHISKGIRSIGSYAFQNCTGLTEIVIPDSVEEIGSRILSGCTGIEKITLSQMALNKSENNYGVVLTMLGSFNNKTVKEITLSSNVTAIPNRAFENFFALEKVTIPETVTSIKDYAFSGCTGLIEIKLSNNLKSIGSYAFYGCSGLTEIDLKQVTSIADYAFSGCTGLIEIKLSNNLKSIGSYAFYGCSGLTEIVIPDSVEEIGSRILSGCTGIEKITLSQMALNKSENNYGVVLTMLGSFNNKTVKEITLSSNVTAIPNRAFENFFALEKVTIPETVTSIKDYAFSGCTGLIEIKLSNNLKSIGSYAFYGCSGLTEIDLKQVTSIADNAFSGCTGLIEIKLSNNLKSIGSYAFYGCSGLTEIVIPDSVEEIGSRILSGCTGIEKITLSQIALNKSENNYGVVLTMLGSFNNKTVKEITLSSNVTAIPNRAFENFFALEKITANGNISSIGEKAFYGCSNVTFNFKGSYPSGAPWGATNYTIN